MFLQTLQQWGQQFKPTDKKQNKVRKTPPKENKYIIRLIKLFILFYFSNNLFQDLKHTYATLVSWSKPLWGAVDALLGEVGDKLCLPCRLVKLNSLLLLMMQWHASEIPTKNNCIVLTQGQGFNLPNQVNVSLETNAIEVIGEQSLTQ